MDIHEAAANGNLEHIRLLLKEGKNIYKPNDNNDCPLAMALANKHEDVAMELLAVYEQDLALIDTNYKGVIYLAVSDEDMQCLSNLNSNGKANSLVKVSLKNSAKNLNEVKDVYVTTKEDLQLLNKLSDDNGLIDVNIKNLHCTSLLALAIEVGNVEIVTRLLKLNATPVSNKGTLNTTVKRASFEIIDQLLKHIPYNSLNSDDDVLLLQQAAKNKNTAVFYLILELLADLELQKIKTANLELARNILIKNLLETITGEYYKTSVLHVLIRSQHFQLVMDLLDKYNPSLDIATNDYINVSLLDSAIIANSLELVKVLIDKGVDILKDYSDREEDYFRNSLIVAAGYGDYQIFEEIVKHCPSEIFKEGSHGSVKALYHCIRNASIDKVKLLIECGMDLHAQEEGSTALIESIWSDNLEMVKFVMNHLKTDPETGKCIYLDTQNSAGNSPIDFSVRSVPKRDIFNYLLELGANLNSADGLGWSPLHFASRFGHHEIVKIMLDHGADITQVNDKGDKPIQSALKSGNYETFKLFFNSDVDLEMRNVSGNTLLISAAKFNTFEAFKDILHAGGDIHAENYGGQTALHFANNLETIKTLIERGSNPLARDKMGNTPYLYNAGDSDWRTEQFVNHLKFDIDYSLVNDYKYSILHYILHNGAYCLERFPEIFTEEKFNPLFESSGLNEYGQSTFYLSCFNSGVPLEIVKRIVENSNPDLNLRAGDGGSALHCLVMNRSYDTLDYVLGKGADIEMLSKEGQETPLLAGVSCPKIVRILVKYGANVNAQNADGKTALHKAAETGNLESVRILVAAGADLQITDKNNKTALDYSSNCNMTHFLTLLL